MVERHLRKKYARIEVETSQSKFPVAISRIHTVISYLFEPCDEGRKSLPCYSLFAVVSGYQAMLLSHCNTIIRLIADKMAISSYESNHRLLKSFGLGCKIPPERMRKEISRKWFYKDLIVKPYEMQLRIFYDHDSPTTSSLVMQWRDM